MIEDLNKMEAIIEEIKEKILDIDARLKNTVTHQEAKPYSTNHLPDDTSRMLPITRGVRNGLSILQEFYTEFFGLFIPGFVFVMSLVFMIFFAYKHMFAPSPNFNLADIFGHIWVQLFVLCLSYVIGTVLYRKAPKRPDRISAYLQWVKTTFPFERNRLSVQYDASRDMPPRFRNTMDWFFYHVNPERYILNCIYRSKPRMIPDYPYPCLRQYLLQRGMWHLLPYVPWCAHSEMIKKENGINCADAAIFERSKHLINILKQRIRVYGVPTINSDITRNESQIRLLSSIWYAMQYLIFCGVAIIGYPLLCLMGRGFRRLLHVITTSDSITALTFPRICGGWTFFLCMVAVVCGIWWIMRNITGVIHYMRNREVVMILEAAYLIDMACDARNKKWIFSDIRERTEEFTANLDACKCKCFSPYFEKCLNRKRGDNKNET